MKNSQELHRKTFELTLALYRVTDFFPQGEVLKRQLREKANEIFGNVTEYKYADGREHGALSLLAKVETMKGYLRVAASMRLVRPINLTILEREYELLEHFLRQELDGDHVPQDRDRNPGEISYNQHNLHARCHSRESGNPERINTGFPIKSGMTMRGNHVSLDKMSKDNGERVSGEGIDMTDRQKKILDYVGTTPRAKISDFHTLLIGVSAKTIQRDLHDLVQKNILKKDGEKRWTVYSLKL